MAAALPQTVATPKLGQVSISTANTNRDGTGTLGTVYTAGSAGSRHEKITVEATGTTTAGMVRIYISTDGGTNKYLYDEFAIAAITPSATVKTHRESRTYGGGIVLPASAIMYASTHNAEAFIVRLEQGGDY